MYSFASLNILNPKYIKQNVFSSPNCQCISRYHDPKVECDQCGESVPAYRLKLHKKSHWSEDQLPFKCSFCSKGFLQKNKLVDHENMHRGEKPHKVISIAPSLFFLGYGLHYFPRSHSMLLITLLFVFPVWSMRSGLRGPWQSQRPHQNCSPRHQTEAEKGIGYSGIQR